MATRNTPIYAEPDLWLDDDHFIEWSYEHGEITGILTWHINKATGAWCLGAVQWAGQNQPQWQLVSREPLTISPSVLCNICGDHGFIRDGKWIVA